MYNCYRPLVGRIVEKFGSRRAFARKIGKSEQTVIAKLNGRVGFSQDDIAVWSKELEIDADEVVRYFFEQKLQNA